MESRFVIEDISEAIPAIHIAENGTEAVVPEGGSLVVVLAVKT